MALAFQDLNELIDSFYDYDSFRRQSAGLSPKEIAGRYPRFQLVNLRNECKPYLEIPELYIWFDDETDRFKENMARLEEAITLSKIPGRN